MSKEARNIEELLEGVDAWHGALKEDGRVGNDGTQITINEAFMTANASILFPKVISRTLKEAAEPTLLVTPLLEVVRLGQGRSLEFPAVNAIQAAEIAEGQEYPEQQLAFGKQAEGKVTKKGVKVAFTDEVINDSLWDIVGLHVRAAGRAMARLKEQIALDRFADASTVVFDNDSSTYPDTTGLGSTGTANLTLTWDDVVEMAAELMAESHIATDFIIHPLAWSLFIRDSSFHYQGANVKGAWDYNVGTPGQVANSSSPLGLNVVVSPFVGFTAKSGATPAKSDVFLIDRNEVGVLLVKDEMSTDDWTDQTRDIRYLKMKERYDVVMMGDGEGITVAKNIRIARSYDVELNRTVS